MLVVSLPPSLNCENILFCFLSIAGNVFMYSFVTCFLSQHCFRKFNIQLLPPHQVQPCPFLSQCVCFIPCLFVVVVFSLVRSSLFERKKHLLWDLGLMLVLVPLYNIFYFLSSYWYIHVIQKGHLLQQIVVSDWGGVSE